MNVLIPEILSRIPTKYLLVASPFLSFGGWYYYDYSNLKNKVESAPTQQEVREAKITHSYEIIKFHLQYLSDDQMKETVEKWSGENWRWGAQIAAIRNVCKNDPEILSNLMYEEDIVYLCRLVN